MRMNTCPCCGKAPADGQALTVSAYVVSDHRGEYVRRLDDKAAAQRLADKHEGWAVGIELSDGCVTFDC